MKTIFLIIGCFLSSALSYKFLIFNPLFAHSHNVFLSHIADTLTEAGHNVTILMPVMDPYLLSMQNNNRKTADVITIEADPRVVKFYDYVRPYMFGLASQLKVMSGMVQNISNCITFTTEKVLSHKELLDELKARKYDVGIAEPMTLSGFGLFKLLGIPSTIGALSFSGNIFFAYDIGEPSAPSYVPAFFYTGGENPGFFGRVFNFIIHCLIYNFFPNIAAEEHKLFAEKFGDDFQLNREIVANSSFMFVNSNPFINYPFPKIHKTVEVGGISVDFNNLGELGEKWNNILNERKHSVFITFGTISLSRSMPEEWKLAIVQAAKESPDVTFILKYEEELKLAENIPNLHLANWLPQKALLADKRLSLFITHGGIGSIYELAYLGKASIILPLVGDQFRNAAMVSRFGGALTISSSDMSSSTALKEAIFKVLNDESYAKNAEKLSALLRAQPYSPKNLVVKYAEFVAKFGQMPQLDPYGRKLTFLQYYSIDVIVFLVVVLIFLSILSLCGLRKCYRKICSKFQKVKHE